MFNRSPLRVKKKGRLLVFAGYHVAISFAGGVNKRFRSDAKSGGEPVLASSCCSSLPGHGSGAAHRDGFVRKRIRSAPLSGVIGKKKGKQKLGIPFLFSPFVLVFGEKILSRCF